MLRRNVGIRLPTDATSYPRITEASATPLRKPQDSHSKLLFQLFIYPVIAAGKFRISQFLAGCNAETGESTVLRSSWC
jgi:hypothetical protein